MKHFPTILGHEIRMLLVNPGTYIAAVLFLGVMGFVFTGILETYNASPQETPPAVGFFQVFFIPVLFMVPLLTMKCLAEERRLGTIETLLTTPVSTTEVVLGKYGAAYALYLAMWGSTTGLFYIFQRFVGDRHLTDTGPVLGGYLFIAVSGLLFVALGVLASALCRSQSVAGILCFTLLFGLIVGGNYLSSAAWLDRVGFLPLRSVVEYTMVFEHLGDFTRGVVDVRQLLFYGSGTVVALILSVLSVEAKLIHS
jgi:ABC-2 type transport system permease protein